MIGLFGTVIASIVAGVLVYILQQKIKENRELRKQNEERKSQHELAIESGMVCILRKHLIDEYEYWMEKGYITPTALESGLAMYGAYKMLGGNGMIDHMKEDIQNLRIHE